MSLRRMCLDVVIGWNQGAAERLERRATRHRRLERRARAEYRRCYLTRWLP